MEPLPILMIYNHQILLPLYGLARRTRLRSLSEKRVTTKVREILRCILNNKKISIACAARWEKGRWIGEGFYNGEKFNWIVINGIQNLHSLLGNSWFH